MPVDYQLLTDAVAWGALNDTGLHQSALEVIGIGMGAQGGIATLEKNELDLSDLLDKRFSKDIAQAWPGLREGPLLSHRLIAYEQESSLICIQNAGEVAAIDATVYGDIADQGMGDAQSLMSGRVHLVSDGFSKIFADSYNLAGGTIQNGDFSMFRSNELMGEKKAFLTKALELYLSTAYLEWSLLLHYSKAPKPN